MGPRMKANEANARGLHHYRHGGNLDDLDDGWMTEAAEPAALAIHAHRDRDGNRFLTCTCNACGVSVDAMSDREAVEWHDSHPCGQVPAGEWDDTLDGQAEVQQRAWDRRPLTGMRGWTA